MSSKCKKSDVKGIIIVMYSFMMKGNIANLNEQKKRIGFFFPKIMNFKHANVKKVSQEKKGVCNNKNMFDDDNLN
jgi:hypothetical protein